MVARIHDLDRDGLTLVAIADQVGVDTATVRVALGRRKGSAGWEARKNTASSQVNTGGASGTTPAAVGTRDRAPTTPSTGSGDSDSGGAEDADSDRDADGDRDADQAAARDAGVSVLPVLPTPAPRITERVMARWGLLDEAGPVFTPGAHLPYAGLLLILPALAVTGLLQVFDDTYGRLKNGFYGLRVVVLTLVFLALLREPRAEGLTRVTPHDLGRLLGLDRAPEVKTLRRKLGELAGHGRGVDLQRGLAAAHAKARPEALGFLLVDGHLRAYFGTRDLPKTHVARLHMAARATAETWVCDVDGDPVMVVIAPPSASLAAELVRLLPDLRGVVGPDRRVTMIFDRGGWSPLTFKKIIDAGFDIITYRKGDFDELPAEQFAEHVWCDPGSGVEYTYQLGETTVTFDLRKHGELELRQIHKQAADGTQVPIVTSRTDLAAAEVCWRLGGRWRQENYFRYARQHFDLDALDTYADLPDDPDRLVPDPAKVDAKTRVAAARQALADAQAGVSTAVDTAAVKARQTGKARTVEVDPGRDPGGHHRPPETRPGPRGEQGRPRSCPAGHHPPAGPAAGGRAQADHPRHPHGLLQR